MSGLAGIWHRDGTALEPSALPRMLDHVAHRGPDGRGLWRHDGIAIGGVSAHVLPETIDAPLVDEAGRVFSFDGRIDNREDVAAALADGGWRCRSLADAEVAFQACVAWGEEAPARLLGDFALVLWDAPARRLLCARDVQGIRPFCYRVDGARFAWASEAQALVKPPFDQPPPNEALVAEYLTGILTTNAETLFRGVLRLAPATLLIATPETVRLREYWRIDPRREIRYASDREYDEHYVSVLRPSVECRLRSTTDIGVLLSGGIDSSVVAGAAVESAGAGRVHTFSLSCPGASCDERPFAEAVVARWGLEPRATILADPVTDPYARDVDTYRDLPTYPNGARSEALFEIARRRNVRLILTGLGGDEWFTGHQAHYADLLAGGHPVRALRAMRRDIQTAAIGGWRTAIWNAIRPLMPPRLLAAGRRATGHSVVPAWIRPDFARRVDLEDRLYSAPQQFGFPTHAQNEMFREAMTPFGIHGLEMFDRTIGGFGLEAAHPLEDRRLMEFGLALPEAQRWADGLAKSIVRRAAAPLLPGIVAGRSVSPDYVHVFSRAFEQIDARARLNRPGEPFDSWVDRRRLLEAYDRRDAASGASDWSLWMATAVRLWADAVFQKGEVNERRHAAA